MDDPIVEAPDLQEPIAEPIAAEPIVETPEEEVDWEAKAKELESTNKQLFARAKKAEAAAKPAAPEAKEGDLSGKDVLALSGSGVTDEDDIDLVQKAAKLQGVTVAEALKDTVVQGLLKGKQEERRTATASTTGGTRRTPIERTGKDLVDAARKGTLPDPKDLDKMIRSRIGIKE